MYGDKASVTGEVRASTSSLSGWDDDPSHPAPGGVFWTQAPWSRDRNTVSNGPRRASSARTSTCSRSDELVPRPGRSGCTPGPQHVHARPERPVLGPHRARRERSTRPSGATTRASLLGAGTLLYKATHERKLPGRRQGGRRRRHWPSTAPRTGWLEAADLVQLDLLQEPHAAGVRDRWGSTYRDAQQAYADSLWSDVRDPETDLFLRSRRVPLHHAARPVRRGPDLRHARLAAGSGASTLY